MNDERELKGVAGWLAFLVLALCVIGPLRYFIDQFFEFQTAEATNAGLLGLDMWRRYKTLLWCVFGLVVAARLYAGYRLTHVFNVRSVWIAIAILFATPVLMIFGNYLALSAAFGLKGSKEIGEAAIQLAQGWVVAAIWTAYLIRSRRVANTYGKPLGNQDLVATPPLRLPDKSPAESYGEPTSASAQKWRLAVKLGGWQRLGIVLSLLWIALAAAYAVFEYLAVPFVAHPFLTEFKSSGPAFVEDGQTWRPMDTHLLWGRLLAFALGPVVGAWVTIYLCRWIYSWVRAGFEHGGT